MLVPALDSKSKGLLIRCDGSLEIGMGHVMRCQALAEVCLEQTIPFCFAMSADASKGIDYIQQKKWPLLLLEPERSSSARIKNLTIIEQYLEQKQFEWLLIDHYEYTRDDFAHWQTRQWKLAVLDDIANRDLSGVDLIINQNLNAQEYIPHYPSSSKLLLGLKYCLIRNDFHPFSSLARQDIHKPLRVLLTMGGGDAQKWYAPLLRHLLDFDQSLDIKILSQSPPPKELQPKPGIHNLVFESFKLSPAALFAWADIVISAAGSSVWELCYLGVPMMVTDLVPNQSGIAHAISQDVIYLGAWHSHIGSQLRDYLEQISLHPTQLSQMSKKIKTWIDGQGAQRVIQEMMSKDHK